MLPPPEAPRTYVLRQGRITAAQSRALENSRFLLPFEPETLSQQAFFGPSEQRILDIGCGMGQSLLAMAQAAPACHFLGVEVHRPGVGASLLGIEQLQLSNLWLMCHDARSVLAALPAACLDKVLILFPDPWPKTRHHKRRLIQASNVALITRCLKPNGVLHFATDWADYAESAQQVFAAESELSPCAPPWRAPTKFEARGQRLGHDIVDLAYRRLAIKNRLEAGF